MCSAPSVRAATPASPSSCRKPTPRPAGASRRHRKAVAPGAHALLILDKAGGHTTRKLKPPANVTLVPLPPACPGLNAAENIWQYLRQNLRQTYLANRVLASYTDILDACQDAWRKLLAETGRITSIAARGIIGQLF
jgi:putative transposase